MPAVNLPLQQTHGTLYTVPGTHLRLLFTFLGFTSLGVLLLVFKRYKLRSPPYTGQLNASPATLQKLWISEKSRGIVFQNDIMSVNQPSGVSQLSSAGGISEGEKKHQHRSNDRESSEGHQGDMTASMSIDAGMPLILKSGPPPPPPLTPPTLLTGVFSFQDRRLSIAASSMGDLDTSFFQQPNPDYTLSPSPPESSTTALAHGGQDSPSIPRRRSYTKMLPLSPAHTDSGHDEAAFSPSSFPSSSPILPLAPHESLDSREIDVKGEIISVMDDSGAGWKRHTRVYGGGVCLACLASGSQGGFYGDNVPLEHRR
ncbi:hypothetical protein F5Y00DRAFT_131273 [Daldinia vernicosa]|uniref:uncharacterized protein n=1 Tax=Daldinia vernicosa TaxID=114800 RepID=UPI002008E199|nr:uncharacterized protein F5Y00DRAFT_131273 [Daldinia vernicosa]KAI0853065.1 hypothetical protein F5Y00DRAFT_131273 [Daldinia vernicosa]